MGIKRVVDTDFWTDDKVVEMFSPEDKLFFLYLMTNPHTTQLGIYALNKRVMAFELGYSVDAVSVLLDRFENKYELIKYSYHTNEIAVKNYLRHSIIKGGKPVEDLLNKEIAKVKDKALVGYIFGNLARYDNLNNTVKNILKENENEDENENENENEVSWYESSTNRGTNRPTQTKHKHGRYNNVLLTDIEFEKLKTEFPSDYQDRIERLSEYIESKGAKYKSHLATIRNWARRDKPSQAKQTESEPSTAGMVLLPNGRWGSEADLAAWEKVISERKGTL